MITGHVVIRRFDCLPETDLQPLLEESLQQGFEFLDWLVDDYRSGRNRFDGPGEALFGVYAGEVLIAIGGLSRDPYAGDKQIGRVRRVYVLNCRRGQGVGRLLLERIIDEARRHFSVLTLRTLNEQADGFYRALGFRTEPELDGATHHMDLT